MKNLINFYLYIFAPLSTLILLAKANLIGSAGFVWLLAIYCLIYHPVISGLRLIATNKISKKQLILNFIPFWNWKYFAFLFFNSKG
jgi:hypothetical protein